MQIAARIIKLKRGDFMPFGVGGESIQAEVERTYLYVSPSGKILKLVDCYYMPKFIKNLFQFFCYYNMILKLI